MKRFLLFLIFSACAVFKAYPCLNTYYVFDQEGTLYSMGGEWQYPFNKNFNLERNVTHLKKLEQKLKVEQNYMLLSDYAVCLMKLGKPKVALEILIELYKHYPSEYQIAANLGTAYELNARPDSALKYIKRDMELNPNDHEGSEWIHVKVLEAKLALQQNPDYLHDHSVLGLKQAQKKDSLLFKQLTIQLQERVPFTPVPDPILASLFTDLGDLSAAVRSVEYARAYYHIAKDYCGSQHPELDVKIKTMDKLINKYAAVPVPHRSMEETPTHVGFFRYTELLKDNDAGHYMINWDRLNTNVAELTAYVDYTKSRQEARTDALKKEEKQKEEPKLTANKDDSLALKQGGDHTTVTDAKKQMDSVTHWGPVFMWLYMLLVLVTGIGLYLLVRRLRK